MRIVAALVLALVATTPNLRAQDTRTFQLESGTVRVVAAGHDSDHVLVIGPSGDVVSDSWCSGAGMRYDDTVRFFTEFQRRLSKGDRAGVTQMLSFPLRVYRPRLLQIRTPAEMTRRFDEVLTPAAIEKVKNADPRLAFCNWRGTMLGSGVVWADVRGGHLAVIAVNQ